MKLSIDFPPVSPAVVGGKVAHWHKETGEAVAYGDDLYDIAIVNISRSSRKMPSRLRRFLKNRNRELPGVTLVYRITSMDEGTLSAIAAPVGKSIEVGDVVGVLDTHDESQKTAQARTSFNVVRENPGQQG